MSTHNDLTLTAAAELVGSDGLTATELLDHVLAQVAGTEPSVHAYARVLEEEAEAAAAQADEELAAGRSRWAASRNPLRGQGRLLDEGQPVRGRVPDSQGISPRRRTPRRCGACEMPARSSWAAPHPRVRHGIRRSADRECMETRALRRRVASAPGHPSRSGRAWRRWGPTPAGRSASQPPSNGVVGLKPTQGRISRYGIIPPSGSLDHVGIVTRTVEDCASSWLSR